MRIHALCQLTIAVVRKVTADFLVGDSTMTGNLKNVKGAEGRGERGTGTSIAKRNV